MNPKQIGGVACCVLAVLLFGAAVVSLITRPGPGIADPSGLGISRAVGAFLPGRSR